MNETRRGRPTIRDVAAAADVSIGTVSRVLNQHPNVHERTRNRVLEAMRAMGYEPVFAAQELGRGARPTIGLSTGLGTRRLVPFFQVFHEYLTASVANDGLRFVEIPTRTDGLPTFLCDGMVLFGVHDDDSRIAYLHDHDVPLVLIGSHPDCFSVASDDFSGGCLATRHLLRLGHREIWLITGDGTGQATRDRFQGVVTTLNDAGVDLPPDRVLDAEITPLGGYRAVSGVLAAGAHATAIIASADELAVGAWTACTDHGLRVPQDISIVGFDDLPEIGSELTTVHQDFPTLTQTAIRLLRRAMAGEKPEQVRVPVRLVTRKSTGRRYSA